MIVAELSTNDGLSGGARGAVERTAKTRRRLDVALRWIGSVGAELRAKGRDAPASAIACLTSAGCDGDARHVRVILPGVFDRAPIAAGEASRVPIEGVTCAPKCGVE